MIEVPEDILWDYDTAPEDVPWRLQRIADFFPLYGKERATIALLYAHRLSEDLDLFSQEPVGIEPVSAFLIARFFEDQALSLISEDLERGA